LRTKSASRRGRFEDGTQAKWRRTSFSGRKDVEQHGA
jgi:hypothetical protein